MASAAWPSRFLWIATGFAFAMTPLLVIPFEVMQYARGLMFPHEGNVVGGAIIQGEGYVPSKEGSVVYFNGGDDLSKRKRSRPPSCHASVGWHPVLERPLCGA